MLPILLSGCAAALIPVVAGGVLAKKQIGKKDDSAVPVQAPVQTPTQTAAAQPPVAPAASGVKLLSVKEMPPPTPVARSTSAYSAFATYAIQHGGNTQGGQVRRSVLVDQASLTGKPRFADCGLSPVAVIVDLDVGDKPFNLDDPPSPALGLAAELSAIRASGVTVLWLASQPVEQAPKLYSILRATGLDIDGTDRLMLLRDKNERKQTRRQSAARDWCVIAIAGDKRGDFDEVFDYLRDPDGPIAQSLTPAIGDGWFIAPPPIQ